MCVCVVGVGFPSCSACLRNRAGEGRDPWDGGRQLRKELLGLLSFKQGQVEVGQSHRRATERGHEAFRILPFNRNLPKPLYADPRRY